MTQLLDDELASEGVDPKLVRKHQNLRIIYSISFLLVGLSWGFILNGIENDLPRYIDVATLFFTVSGILLLVYSLLVFKNMLIIVAYSITTYTITLGVMVYLVNAFGLNQDTLPLLCALSVLIAIIFSRIIPLRFKRP